MAGISGRFVEYTGDPQHDYVYTVVSAAVPIGSGGFGLYVISTVVMENTAILRYSNPWFLRRYTGFSFKGCCSALQNMAGIPLGSVFIKALQQIKFRPQLAAPNPDFYAGIMGWGTICNCCNICVIMHRLGLVFLPARKGRMFNPSTFYVEVVTQMLLRAENITKRLEDEAIPVTLVKMPNVKINAGEYVAIKRPSGSGKSSLLYLLGLLDRPSAGKYFITIRIFRLCHPINWQNCVWNKWDLFFSSTMNSPLLKMAMIPMRKLEKLSDSDIPKTSQRTLDWTRSEDHVHKLQPVIGRPTSTGNCRPANNPKLILADEPTGNLWYPKRDCAGYFEILSKLMDARLWLSLMTQNLRSSATTSLPLLMVRLYSRSK